MAPLIQEMADANWESEGFYSQWLAQTYYFVINSTRLITLAGSLTDNNRLHHRFIDHAREERNHEFLLLNDLKHLGGYKISAIPESPVTAGFHQSQFYWIMIKNPIAFFGYVLCLEGLAVEYGARAFERVRARFGDKAANFLKVHSEEDMEHLQSAFDAIKDISDSEASLVIQNLEQAVGLYSRMLSECGASAKVQVIQQAA